MLTVLKHVNKILTDNNIPYEFGEWRSKVQYPYFVGSYSDGGYRYEDNHTSGTLTINGWSRNTYSDLVRYNAKIKSLFVNNQTIVDDKCLFINYGGAFDVPTDDEGLYRIQITIYVDEWEGD